MTPRMRMASSAGAADDQAISARPAAPTICLNVLGIVIPPGCFLSVAFVLAPDTGRSAHVLRTPLCNPNYQPIFRNGKRCGAGDGPGAVARNRESAAMLQARTPADSGNWPDVSPLMTFSLSRSIMENGRTCRLPDLHPNDRHGKTPMTDGRPRHGQAAHQRQKAKQTPGKKQ